LVGESVLHFRILEKIGEGGMGTVYKALDTRLDRLVAIKALHSVHAVPQQRQLIWEARAAAKLRHPNIVIVFDVFSENDTEFIVMEYILGTTLSEVLARGALPLEEALGYAVEIASALEVAHNAGIVHRDLKPSNILVTPAMSVKLVDFGLARLQQQDPDSRTAQRVIAGTCGYMSPEQAHGEVASAQSDVFSFGAVLYEILSGQKAFRGKSAASILAAVLRDEPSTNVARNLKLPALDDIVERCLRKDPKRRFQHMGDVRVALEDARTKGVAPGRTSKSWRAALVYPVLAVTLLASGGLLFDSTRQVQPNSMPIPLTSLPGDERHAAWSPDGRQIAFTWNRAEPGKEDIYVLQPGSSIMSRVTTDTGIDRDPAWSPNGRSIGFVHCKSAAEGECELRLVSPLGGPENTLLSGAALLGRVTWSPDGRFLILPIGLGASQPMTIWRVSADTGERRQLTWAPPGTPGDLGPAISPDGKTLAFCRKTAWRTAELYLLDLKADFSAAGSPRKVTAMGYVAEPAWTPDSRRILFNAQRDAAGIWETDRAGKQVRAVFGVPDTASYPAIARRPDGRNSLIFDNVVGKFSIWRESTDRGPRAASAELAPSTRNQSYPRYSNDGKRIAFSSTRTGHQEIWVADADGSQAVQLTNLQHQLTEVGHWSPNDDRIAFVSQDRGSRQIYLVGSSGGPAVRITNEPGVFWGTGWSHDGAAYYYDANPSGAFEIRKASLGGGKTELVVTNGRAGMESARGVFYYCQTLPDGRVESMRRDSEGDRELKLTPPRWEAKVATPAAGGFYYRAASGEIWYYDEIAGHSVRTLRNLARPYNQFTISPDGKWFAASFEESFSVDLMIMESFH
jgi:serine/threonine protein kinase